jgi:hypothetical protein
MSDPRYDPNFPRYDMPRDYNPHVQWGALAVLLLLIGGIIIASMYSADDTQVASNRPAVTETTGSGSVSPIPTSPPAPSR